MTKDIKGFENYVVSDDGKVFVKDRVLTYNRRKKDGTILAIRRNHKGHELIPWKNNGYPCVTLCNGKEMRRKAYIHTLVAEAFLDKPSWAECVNHKDGNKSNNHVSNLEWCTYSENNQHAYDNGLTHAPKLSSERAKAMRSKADMSWNYTKVIDLTTGKIYESISSTKEDGFSPNNVQKVCAGNAKTHYGHIFAYYK